MAFNPFNPIVKPLGPVINAFRQVQQSIYSPPRNAIQGLDANLWPNPLQPVQPIAPAGADPLGWPMEWGRNINITPRDDAEYSAGQLRQFARYILARICIENNKDILTRMPHKIQLKALPGETAKDRAKRQKGDKNIIALSKAFERPDQEHDWSDWLRPILDDMLVIDAASIFVARSKNGKVSGFRWVEGSNILRLVDKHGWTPPPPSPAYQQLWEGYPRLDLTTDQLVYRPRNIVPRNTQASYLYGMSPVEQVVQEIEIGIARLQFIKDFYTEGTVPGAMFFVPRGTTPEKVKEAQDWLDSNWKGDLAKRRRIAVLQGFQEPGSKEDIVFPKEPELADVFDDYHIRKICFAFGTSPQRLMRQMNRASANAMQEAAEEEGTLPWLNWLKGMMDNLIQRRLGFQQYEFAFDPFVELDRLKQAMADAEDIKVGLYTRNEKRQDRGDDPYDSPEADELNVITAQGVVPLDYDATMQMNAPNPSGPSGSSKPGAPQPKTVRRVAARASLSANKTNGHTEWGCSDHPGVPKIDCIKCVRAEIDYCQRKLQEAR